MEKQVSQEGNPRIFDPYDNFPHLSKAAKTQLYCRPTNIIYSDPKTKISNLMTYVPSNRPPFLLRFAEVQENTIVIAIDAARKYSISTNVSFGVWFGISSLYNANGLLPKTLPQTYQAAELYAAKTALETFRDKIHSSINNVLIMTESQYITDSMSKDIWKWEANGYTTARKSPVSNSDTLRQVHGLIMDLEEKDIVVQFWMVEKRFNQEARNLAQGVIDMMDEAKKTNKRRSKKKKKQGEGSGTGIHDADIEDNADDAALDGC